MNPLTVVTLLACLAFSAAQLTGGLGQAAPTGGPLDGGLSGSGGLGSPLGGSGPLTQTSNPAANNPTNTGASANNPSSGINQVFQNPALSYGLMGGDNPMRAMMAPYLSRFGNVPTLYFLRGGMDKFSSVLMSDMMNRMLSRATGMNPVLSAFMTGQMFDAPDNYALSNMLFNGMNNRGQTNQVNNAQTGGLLPNGAAQTGSPNSLGNSAISPFLLAPFLF